MKYLELLKKLRDDIPLKRDELEALLFWMQSKDGRRLVENELSNELNLFTTTESYDYQRLLAKLNQKIDSIQAERKTHPSFRRYLRYAVEAAAVIVLVAGISTYMRHYVEQRYSRYIETLTPERIEIYNPKGLITTITLPDRSTVTLNADSKISYLKEFLPNERSVYLEGEAFFEVTGDQIRPFVVHISATTLTVMGTSFNVRAYPEDASIQTTLVSGSLRVSSQSANHLLKPGDQSNVDKISLENSVKEIDVAEATGWMEGKLYFRQTRFADIVVALERTFSVNIRVDKPLLLLRNFTGQFEHGESLEQILEVLKLSASFTSTYHKDTNLIVIK